MFHAVLEVKENTGFLFFFLSHAAVVIHESKRKQKSKIGMDMELKDRDYEAAQIPTPRLTSQPPGSNSSLKTQILP